MFIGSALQADLNRQRVAAELRGKRASIGLWLTISFAAGIVLWTVYDQLLAAEAALKFAGGV